MWGYLNLLIKYVSFIIYEMMIGIIVIWEMKEMINSIMIEMRINI